MNKLAVTAVLAVLAATPALAQDVALMTNLPSGATTVTNYYKQSVYDPQQNKIGSVDDVLVTQDGKVVAAIIGVGGFLGMGEKDVAVPMSALQKVQKNNSWYLTLNTTKDALKNAPGYKYDRTATTWVPDTSTTTGSGTTK